MLWITLFLERPMLTASRATKIVLLQHVQDSSVRTYKTLRFTCSFSHCAHISRGSFSFRIRCSTSQIHLLPRDYTNALLTANLLPRDLQRQWPVLKLRVRKDILGWWNFSLFFWRLLRLQLHFHSMAHHLGDQHQYLVLPLLNAKPSNLGLEVWQWCLLAFQR